MYTLSSSEGRIFGAITPTFVVAFLDTNQRKH